MNNKYVTVKFYIGPSQATEPFNNLNPENLYWVKA